MNALILAAGTGSRLVNLTRELPKALVQVQGQPLLAYTLRFVESVGCERIVAVGGFYFEKIQAYLNNYPGNLTLVENTEFLKGSIVTLALALDAMHEAFLLMNVDHIFPCCMARRFAETQRELQHITACVDFDRPLYEDDMKVQVDAAQRVQRISKGLHAFDAGYIGMTYVPRDKLAVYKHAAFELKAQNEEAVVEQVLQKLVDQGEMVHIVDMSGMRWLEVDNQWDLQNAERILRRVPGYLD